MRQNADQWARALFLAMEGKSKSTQKKILSRARSMLRKRGQEYMLLEIGKSLERLVRRKNEVEISVARKHPSAVTSSLKRFAAQSFGKDVSCKVNVRPELIGGFRMKSEETFLRASLKDVLDEFRKAARERIMHY